VTRHALQLLRAARFVWQGAKGWTIAGLVLVVLEGVLPLAPLLLMKGIVDAATAGLAAPDKAAAFGTLLPLVLLMGAAALTAAILRAIAGVVGEAQAMAVTDHMSDVIHAKSVEIDLAHYESPEFHDTLHRTQREAPHRPTRLVNGLAQAARNGISLLAVAGLLCRFHWAVAAILFAAVLPGIAVRMGYAGTLHRRQVERTSTERHAAYLDRLLTGVAHAREIRLLGLGPLLSARFRVLRRKLRDDRLGIAARRSIADAAAQAGAVAAVYGSLAFIAWRTVRGTTTLGELVMYFQAFQRGQVYLQGMLGGLAGIFEDHLFLSGMHEFLDLERKVGEPAQPVPVPRPMLAGVALDRVSFRYPEGARNVLEDVSLSIRPGEIVALVGENGSGKTTLVKLLCRLYDPTGGTITLDGTDLRRFGITPLRRGISVLFQDCAQYHLSARENIRFGNVALAPDDARIPEAARASGADAVIRSLSRGYDTVLGRQFDDGEELSLGEWQKVALARAFLGDAQVVVLDEPTSAQDAAAEEAFFGNFRRQASGRAALLISHRFSTVRMADRICVLQGGRIVEEGTHDALVRSGGTYARLFDLQARPYR
jgi:ATP-binding cassette subfamily B protein